MTVDLTYLVWTVALTLVQLLVVIVGAMATIPTGVLAGNRETPVEAKAEPSEAADERVKGMPSGYEDMTVAEIKDDAAATPARAAMR